MSKGELIKKIQEYGNLCGKIGYETADHDNGHSDVDPALEARRKILLDEIIQIISRVSFE